MTILPLSISLVIRILFPPNECYNRTEMGKFTRKKKSERIKEILDAGIEVFGRKGFHNTTMEDIMLAIMESETDIAYTIFLDELSGFGREELISAIAKAMGFELEERGCSVNFLKHITGDERIVFLARLNTVMILFFHIFPGKKMMEKYLFYIEDLFVRILEDITVTELQGISMDDYVLIF